MMDDLVRQYGLLVWMTVVMPAITLGLIWMFCHAAESGVSREKKEPYQSMKRPLLDKCEGVADLVCWFFGHVSENGDWKRSDELPDYSHCRVEKCKMCGRQDKQYRWFPKQTWDLVASWSKRT